MRLIHIIIIGIIIIVLGIVTYFHSYNMVMGQLTTGDIARFTQDQTNTYQTIGRELGYLKFDLMPNNSTLTTQEIQNKIMEYFILNSINYCHKWIDNDKGGYCDAKMNMSGIVADQYFKIVMSNQPVRAQP